MDTMIVCPTCTSDMKELKPDCFICPVCSARVDQLNLFKPKVDRRMRTASRKKIIGNGCVSCGKEKELVKSSYCDSCRDALLKQKVRES